MIEIYIIDTDPTNDVQFFDFLKYVSDSKQEKINRTVNTQDKINSLVGDLFIRLTISNIYNVELKDICFTHNKYGKPFLKHPVSNFVFNVSHSENLISIIYSDNSKYVGIDIEEIKDIDYGIAQSFFALEEYLNLIKQGSNKLQYFYELWTLKESYVKAIGKGLYTPLNSFSVSRNGDKIYIKDRGDLFRPYFNQYTVKSNFVLSACSDVPIGTKNIKFINSNILYREIMSKSVN